MIASLFPAIGQLVARHDSVLTLALLGLAAALAAIALAAPARVKAAALLWVTLP